MDLIEYERLVGRIYEAAQQPEAWGPVLAELGEHLGLDGWNLMRFAPRQPAPHMLALGGDRITAESVARYQSYYAAIDPRAQAARDAPIGSLLACQHLFDERFVSHNEFYQDFLIPDGLRYAVGSSPLRCETHDYVLGLLRGPDRGPFEEPHLMLLRRLVPHIQRALKLTDHLATNLRQAELNAAALKVSPVAAFAMDDGGRLRHGNPRGEQMLRAADLLRLQAGVITPANVADERHFADAVAQCARTGNPATLLLRHRDHPAERHSVTLLKPATDGPLASLDADRGLLCLVAPLDRRRMPTVRQLIGLFRLTPAEARLARAIAAGETLEGYADANGLKLSTLRTQLRSIFNKTGTDRQTTLVRLIAGIPVVREPTD